MSVSVAVTKQTVTIDDGRDVVTVSPVTQTVSVASTGPQGATVVSVAVGTTTTGAAGSNASVANSGSSTAAVLDFTIPRGNTGATGATGPAGSAATIAVGSVTQGTAMQVTNSGSSSAAVFDFVLVKGDKGDTGNTGATGAKGDKGDTGDPGASGVVSVNAPLTNSGTSGSANISVSAASTSAAGVVQLSDSTSTTSSVLAATPTAVKSAYDLAAGKVASVAGTGAISSTGGTAPVISIADAGTATVGAVQLTNSTSSTSTTTAATPSSVKSAYDLAAAAVPSSNYLTSLGYTATSIETISRAYASFVNVNLSTSGRALFAMVRPAKDLTIGTASVHCVGAGTSMSVARLGLYTWNDASGTAILVAQTANDTTIFGTANTLQSRAFDTAGGYPATYTMLAGSAYAFALVCVATGTMPFVGGIATNAALTFASPRIFGVLTGQTDLPGTTSSLASTTQGVWGRFS